jgi:hypothetical protein
MMERFLSQSSSASKSKAIATFVPLEWGLQIFIVFNHVRSTL